MNDAMEDAPRFDRIARAYDLLVNEPKRWANEAPTLRRWLESASEGRRRVLDMGCGTGFHARHLAAHLNAAVVGADPSAAMLAVAARKEHGDRVRWVNAGAATPPPGPFDLILLLGNTLSLLASPAESLGALRRVAADEARLAIQTLDYEALRAAGPSHLKREGDGVSIEKQLTPLAPSEPAAATLRIIVREADGELLDELTEALIDHPTPALVDAADAAGWTLLEQRRSYHDALTGTDRIVVFGAH
ncbi:MAG: class I SAM-dependent methyltransferase [Planctomycetota bacterium]|nr:class I SAM-dependent methyltransferase [Planctomycetota bacterium]